MFVIQRLFLERERLVYSTLNKFKRQGGSLLLGFCWIPKRDEDFVMDGLEKLKNTDEENI